MPFFSVVVPIYNVEKYLRQCVESILNQDVQELEIILVDDGSTDASSKICDEFQVIDDRVVVIHQKNKGLAGARNSGIKQARGKWILFLDSDDFWQEGFLSKLKLVISSQSEQDVIIGRYFVLTEESNTLKESNQIDFLEGTDEILNYQESINRYSSGCQWSAWKIAIKKETLFEKGLLFNEAVIWSEDIPWSFEIFRLCEKVYYTNLHFCVYREGRPDSLMNCNFKKHLVGIKASFEYFSEILQNGKQKDFILQYFADLFIQQSYQCGRERKAQREQSAIYIAENIDIVKLAKPAKVKIWLVKYGYFILGVKATLWLTNKYFRLLRK